MKRRLNRQRLISVLSYVSPQPDIPATFDLLNDDTKRLILKFVGNKSYKPFGSLNKQCREVYLNTPGTTKETFLFGYGPLSVIIDKIERDQGYSWVLYQSVGKGVVFYNRRDVFDWALEEQNTKIMRGIYHVAADEERTDLLDEVWNNVEDEYDKEIMFEGLYSPAARRGKLNVLKWLCTKSLSINKERCAEAAAHHGRLHILQWLREVQDLQLASSFYDKAIDGGQLHVMKWLREQSCPWDVYTFKYAAQGGHLDILQFLHDEACPWDRSIHMDEDDVTSEVIEWLRINGYGDRTYRID